MNNSNNTKIKKKSLRKKTPPKLSLKQDLLLERISDFYNKKDNIDKLLDIINSSSKISLRIIDWFVTNYSKKNYVIIPVKKKHTSLGDTVSVKTMKRETTIDLNVFLDYKAQLKGYSKKHFDPFCRRERVSFKYNNNKDSLITTVGQLHFFKWAIENGIINYIEDHLSEIEEDMNTNIKKNNDNLDKKKNKKSKKTLVSFKTTDNSHNIKNEDIVKLRKKRRELSKSAVKSMNRHLGNVVLSFD